MEPVPTSRPLSDSDPRRIGAYVIQGVLGEGGTGVVYLAEHCEPMRRRVAIKLLQEQQAVPEAAARFHLEMEALARLVHPGIARIYESGHLEDGRPYYVMEHISGEALTAFCDKRRYDVRERLALFLDVCAAVQHAHQHGIIHRDLKPTNVLVTEAAATAEPKLIDFGLAKVLAASASTEDHLTRAGTILGTLDYMSPEQARGAAEVDSRADVFGLGMMLYELSTGVLPRTHGSGSDVLGALRRAQHEEPPRASESVELHEGSMGEIAARRRTTPRKLQSRLRGDVDAILAKALRSDPNQRYSTVAEMAADIRSHLAGFPVSAHPRNVLYLVRKVLLRDRVVAWAIAMIVFGVALTASITTSAIERRVRYGESRTTLIRISERIHDLASVSHLRLEEVLAAQPVIGADDPVRSLRAAVELCRAALEGRSTALGTARAVGVTADRFRHAADLLERLSVLARDRTEEQGDSPRSGTTVYSEYHATYAAILKECLAIAGGLGSNQEMVSVSESWGIAAVISMVLVGVFVAIRRVARPRE